MINLNDHIKEIDGVEYVPLKLAQQAVAEVYNYEKYQAKLDNAMADFKKAMNDINSITDDLDD